MRIAFFHLMKTAGSTVNWAVANRLADRRYQLQGIDGRDWTERELLEFLEIDYPLVYVHNHAANWSPKSVRHYLNLGWFVYSFYRHPGDQWCSFYFWLKSVGDADGKRKIVHRLSLDEFLRLGWSEPLTPRFIRNFRGIRRNLDLPENWRDFHFVANYSDEAFNQFLKLFLNCKRRRIKKMNPSENRGYDYYRSTNEISDETHELLIQSDRYRNFQELEKGPHYHQHDRFLAKNNPVFHRRWFTRSSKTRFVILYHDSETLEWLSGQLRNHWAIKALHDIFETIPKKDAAQQAWLNNFFVKRRPRGRHLKSFGFRTRLSSVINADDFRQFIETQDLRIIHLENETENSDELQRLKDFTSTIRAPRLKLTSQQILENPVWSTNKVFDFLGVMRIDSKEPEPETSIRKGP